MSALHLTSAAAAAPPVSSWLAAVAAGDAAIARAVHRHMSAAPDALVQAVAWISHLGDRWVLGALMALACTALALRGAPRLAVAAGGLMALQGLLVWALKAHWQRARPIDGALDAASVVVNGSSLPSGHATAALVGFGLLAWLALRAGPPAWRAHRRAIVASAVLLAAAIGVSRVLLGVHYPTDVLAGWCVGGLWLALCSRCLPRLLPRHAPAGWHGPGKP